MDLHPAGWSGVALQAPSIGRLYTVSNRAINYRSYMAGTDAILSAEPSASRKKARRTLTVISASLLTASIAAAAAFLHQAPSPAATETAASPAADFLVGCSGDGASDGNACAEYIKEVKRRKGLTAEAHAQLEATGEDIFYKASIAAEHPECAADFRKCGTGSRQEALLRIRSALKAAHYDHAIVRTALPNDAVAEEGGIIVAVPIGTGCVIANLGPGMQQIAAMGPLHDGSCL
jgi:hypothetical protein